MNLTAPPPNTVLVLACFKPGESLKNADVRERSSLDSEQVEYALRGLSKTGKLIRAGRGRYVLSPQPSARPHQKGSRLATSAAIARVMSDGRSYAIAELAAMTGLPREIVTAALSRMARQKRAVSEPVRYALTPEGMDRSIRKPRTETRRLQLKAARQANKRAAEREEARQQADAIVAQAKAKPHALHSIWGGVNA